MVGTDCLKLVRSICLIACTCMGCFLATIPAGAQGAQLIADAEKLDACINEAFPESEPSLRPGQTPQRRPAHGECSGIVAKSCKPQACNERESRAWLHLAQQVSRSEGSRVRSGVNGRAWQTAFSGIERQALAVCTAAAAASAWGSEMVSKGKFKASLAHPCVREAIAGMVIPMLGYSRGA